MYSKADQATHLLAEVVASAFASGVSWSASRGAKQLYCPPPGLKGEEIMSAFERFLADHPGGAEKQKSFASGAWCGGPGGFLPAQWRTNWRREGRSAGRQIRRHRMSQRAVFDLTRVVSGEQCHRLG